MQGRDGGVIISVGEEAQPAFGFQKPTVNQSPWLHFRQAFRNSGFPEPFAALYKCVIFKVSQLIAVPSWVPFYVNTFSNKYLKKKSISGQAFQVGFEKHRHPL